MPPGVAAKLHLLEELRRSSPSFFEAHDYGWAFRPESYLVPPGCDPDTADQSLRHQLTVLRTLVGVWDVVRAMRPPVRLDLSGICVRYIVSSELSPTCRISGGFGYLMMPFGFRRLTRELLHALCRAVPVGPREGPACFAALCRPLPPGALDGFALPFVARRLAMGRTYDMANRQGAEDFLLDGVPVFAGARVQLGEGGPGSLDSGLHELLTAFAVNHELGHLLYRHGARGGADDEGVADTASLDTCLRDWGWVADSGAATGLPDPVWVLLGPALFFWAVGIVLRLDRLVLDPVPAADGDRFGVLRARASRVDARVGWLVREVWPAFGCAAPADSLHAADAFRATLDAVAAAFDPSPALAEAIRSGKEALGRGPGKW